MVLRAAGRQGLGMGRVQVSVAGVAIATALGCAVVAPPASAQTMNDALTSRMQGDGKSRLLVEARELIYNNDNNTVTLSGDAELHYQGRTLQADRVIYDRGSGRVYAEGNARITEANGTVVTADRFELSDDFRNGFIDSIRVTETRTERGVPVTTRFSAPRAERIEGETTVFERGTYTACEPCRDNPEAPPLWQIRSARIIHNNSERTVYYEDSRLEFAGIPIAYIPYFWSPDPTVKRRTGLLIPRYNVSSSLGTGISLPFFWNLAPNYDLTIVPTWYSRQGLFGQAEWRHRLMTGAYNIRVAGIFQQDPKAFLAPPFGPGDREFRGSIESAGRFHINERWLWGWDVASLSDKWFLHHYRIRSESLATNYIGARESISQVYLQGKGDRSWFDMRGYYIRGLSTFDWQKQLPTAAPVIDYNKRIDGPAPLGGELALDVNVTHLHREAASFVQVPRLTNFFPVGTPYETCTIFERGRCIVRGISGHHTRASVQASWRRTFIDPIGQSWTPFAYVRADAFGVSPDFVGYQNDRLRNFLPGDPSALRAMPAIGLEYRFPFAGTLGAWGIQQLEPIAQVIARPNETRIGQLPNEDAHSLVFDDTSLFNWDKFSGYDRVEGGVRANLGLKYSLQGANGMYAETLFGQSYNLAGRNSFTPGDIANVGLDSGLQSNRSDLVGRALFAPNRNVALMTRARFDKDNFDIHRFEAGLIADWNPIIPLTTTVTYARLAPQPNLGLEFRREGLSLAASYKMTSHWSVGGSLIFDLDRYLPYRDNFAVSYASYLAGGSVGAPPVYRRPELWSPIGSSLNISYTDECTVFSVNYVHTPAAFASGAKEDGKTLLVRLELRTLGEFNFRQNLGLQGNVEGVAP